MTERMLTMSNMNVIELVNGLSVAEVYLVAFMALIVMMSFDAEKRNRNE